MIETLLKDIKTPSSLHYGNRWLVFDNANEEWNVYKKYNSGSLLIYYGKSLEDAIDVLKNA